MIINDVVKDWLKDEKVKLTKRQKTKLEDYISMHLREMGKEIEKNLSQRNEYSRLQEIKKLAEDELITNIRSKNLYIGKFSDDDDIDNEESLKVIGEEIRNIIKKYGCTGFIPHRAEEKKYLYTEAIKSRKEKLYGENYEFFIELEERGIAPSLIRNQIIKFFGAREQKAIRLYIPKRDKELIFVFYIYLGLAGKSISNWFIDHMKKEFKRLLDEKNPFIQQAKDIYDDLKTIQVEKMKKLAKELRNLERPPIKRPSDLDEL